MSPESLRAYARVGAEGFISWTTKAGAAVVDAVQTTNLPQLDNAEMMAAIHLDFGQPISARAQAVIDAQDERLTDDAPPSSPPRLTKRPPPPLRESA